MRAALFVCLIENVAQTRFAKFSMIQLTTNRTRSLCPFCETKEKSLFADGLCFAYYIYRCKTGRAAAYIVQQQPAYIQHGRYTACRL